MCKKSYLASLGFSFITIGSFSPDIGDIVNKSDTADTEYTWDKGDTGDTEDIADIADIVDTKV